MGMRAELIAFGPFSEDVINLLDYNPDFYEGVEAGTPVVCTITQCETTSSSEALASDLGIEARNFNTHYISGTKVLLMEEKGELGCLEFEFGLTKATMLSLAEKGFNFFYRPEM